jgi:thiol-disulfide isomerase/thioredoxin
MKDIIRNQMKIIVNIFLILAICTNFAIAVESSPPEVGKPLTDYVFTDLVNYQSKKAALKEFKGKWLILDFWGATCSSCIASFPKMNQINISFKDKIQLIMVGVTGGNKQGSEKSTKKLFNYLAGKMKLQFTVAFDSVLAESCKVRFVPYIIVVDPNGIVRAITTKITEQDVSDFLDGRQPILSKSLNDPKVVDDAIIFNYSVPLLTSGNMASGGNDTAFLFRSMLTPYHDNIRPVANTASMRNPISIQKVGNKGSWTGIRYDVLDLFRCAYLGERNIQESSYHSGDLYGKVYNMPIFEIENQLLKSEIMSSIRKVFYNYSLTVPLDKAKPEYMARIMKTDLTNYFGLEGALEERKIAVWKLKIIDIEKALRLKSKEISAVGNQSLSKYEGIDVKNFSMKDLTKMITMLTIGEISKKNAGSYLEEVLIDETGIDYKIDIKIEALMTDINEVRPELQKNGLDLVKGDRVMKVLVLKESNK